MQKRSGHSSLIKHNHHIMVPHMDVLIDVAGGNVAWDSHTDLHVVFQSLLIVFLFPFDDH